MTNKISSLTVVKRMMIFVYGKDCIIATDQVPNGITVTAVCDQKFTLSIAPANSKTSAQKNQQWCVSITR